MMGVQSEFFFLSVCLRGEEGARGREERAKEDRRRVVVVLGSSASVRELCSVASQQNSESRRDLFHVLEAAVMISDPMRAREIVVGPWVPR